MDPWCSERNSGCMVSAAGGRELCERVQMFSVCLQVGIYCRRVHGLEKFSPPPCAGVSWVVH